MDSEKIKEIVKKIFEEHNLVLFDNSNYGEGTGKTINIPEDRIVSHKWVANVLSKKLSVK